MFRREILGRPYPTDEFLGDFEGVRRDFLFSIDFFSGETFLGDKISQKGRH